MGSQITIVFRTSFLKAFNILPQLLARLSKRVQNFSSSPFWVPAVSSRIRCTQLSGLHKIRPLSSRCRFVLLLVWLLLRPGRLFLPVCASCRFLPLPSERISTEICLCYTLGLCTWILGCVGLINHHQACHMVFRVMFLYEQIS